MPLPDGVREQILIRHEGETTTIARVTCPTAPKFWRWRELPWPRLSSGMLSFTSMRAKSTNGRRNLRQP